MHFGQSKVYLGCTLANGNDKLLTSHKPMNAKFQIGSRLSHPVSKDCLKKKGNDVMVATNTFYIIRSFGFFW